MNRSAQDSPAPVTPDDPRISEWIDGRLDDRAAAEIERAVRDSPTLARVVDDLRALKAALGRIDDGPVPAGFVQGVMDAIALPPASDDAAVALEWRRLEAERIAEEREEAHEDEVEAVTHRPHTRWPWLALAGALAAGVLVAVVLNPPRSGREVAVAPNREGDALAISRVPSPERTGNSVPVAADFKEQAASATPTGPAEPVAAAAAGDKAPAVAEALAAKPAEDMPSEVAPPAAAAPSAPEAMAAGLRKMSADAGLVEAATEEIDVAVNGPEDRAVLDELIAALENDASATEGEYEPLRDDEKREADVSARDTELGTMKMKWISVLASPEAIDAFLAAVERPADGRGPARLRGVPRTRPQLADRQVEEAAAKAEAKPERARAAAREGRPRRLVIRVVEGDEPKAARPSDPGPSPGELEE